MVAGTAALAAAAPPRALLTGGRRRAYGRCMGEPIRIARGVHVPAAALEWRAVRSSGPGGQNVNKVASKVELRVDLAAVGGLDGWPMPHLPLTGESVPW